MQKQGCSEVFQSWQRFSPCGGCSSGARGADGAGTGLEPCEQGCAYVHNTTASPLAWKVLLPPTKAGGSYTLTVTCEIGCGKNGQPLVLERVTFGEVFFCSGQSNQVLGIGSTYDFPQTLTDVQSGKYVRQPANASSLFLSLCLCLFLCLSLCLCITCVPEQVL